jgi:hypothetical protein
LAPKRPIARRDPIGAYGMPLNRLPTGAFRVRDIGFARPIPRDPALANPDWFH